MATATKKAEEKVGADIVAPCCAVPEWWKIAGPEGVLSTWRDFFRRLWNRLFEMLNDSMGVPLENDQRMAEGVTCSLVWGSVPPPSSTDYKIFIRDKDTKEMFKFPSETGHISVSVLRRKIAGVPAGRVTEAELAAVVSDLREAAGTYTADLARQFTPRKGVCWVNVAVNTEHAGTETSLGSFPEIVLEFELRFMAAPTPVALAHTNRQ